MQSAVAFPYGESIDDADDQTGVATYIVVVKRVEFTSPYVCTKLWHGARRVCTTFWCRTRNLELRLLSVLAVYTKSVVGFSIISDWGGMVGLR